MAILLFTGQLGGEGRGAWGDRALLPAAPQALQWLLYS